MQNCISQVTNSLSKKIKSELHTKKETMNVIMNLYIRSWKITLLLSELSSIARHWVGISRPQRTLRIMILFLVDLNFSFNSSKFFNLDLPIAVYCLVSPLVREIPTSIPHKVVVDTITSDYDVCESSIKRMDLEHISFFQSTSKSWISKKRSLHCQHWNHL